MTPGCFRLSVKSNLVLAKALAISALDWPKKFGSGTASGHSASAGYPVRVSESAACA